MQMPAEGGVGPRAEKPARISVLIPTYRHERYIAQTLDSVLTQTRRPDEVIVINDGSPDNTTAAVQPYLDRITYIERPNIGLISTLNQGVTMCTGDYIWMIASDDWLEPDAIATMASILDRDDEVGMVYGGVTVVDEHGNLYFDTQVVPFPLGKHRSISRLLTTNFVVAPACLCRKQAVIDAGLFPGHLYCQDWALWLELMLHGWYLYGLDRPIAFYRRHSDNLTSLKNSLAARRDEISMLKGLYRRHHNNLTVHERKTLFTSVHHLCISTGWLNIGVGQRATARRIFLRVLRRRIDGKALRGLVYSMLPRAVYQRLRRVRNAWHQPRSG